MHLLKFILPINLIFLLLNIILYKKIFKNNIKHV